jgi:ketosteroid isomerase-like protein
MRRARVVAAAAAMFVIIVAVVSRAQQGGESATARELTAMLRQFLDDAGKGNAAGFEKFFADDVIYTRSAGVVTYKAEIMKNVGNLRPTTESKTTYSAEDITVHEYGDTAVVAFRLVGRTEHTDGKVEIANYRNTGTFLRRNSRWQVVAWQSTKMPEPAAAK